MTKKRNGWQWAARILVLVALTFAGLSIKRSQDCDGKTDNIRDYQTCMNNHNPK